MEELQDLVEFRFDHLRKVFIKVQTHKTNVPKAIAYAEKKKIEFLRPTSGHTRFVVCPNGTYQYTNTFKAKSTKLRTFAK